MIKPRSSPAVVVTVLAAFLLLLGSIVPALAAPTADPDGSVALTSHVDPEDCDAITVGAGSIISVGGVPLTVVQQGLLDANVLAALQLAADAAAAGEVCVDVVLGGENVVTINADISVCPASVEVDGESNVTIGGVAVDPDLLGAQLTNLLEAAATADVEACLEVTITDNDVIVDVQVEACVMATLNEDGSVSVELGGVDLEFVDGAVVDAGGDLELGVAIEVALEILATLNVETEAVTLVAEVTLLEGCGEVAASSAPSSSAGTGPGSSVVPTNTTTITLPPTDGSAPHGQATSQLVLPIVVLTVVSAGLLMLGSRIRATD